MGTKTGAWAGLDRLLAIGAFVALITQAATGAPTASILDNTLASAGAWARTGVGVYTFTLAGAFPAGKVFAPNRILPGGGRMEIARTDANTLTVSTFDGAGAPADGLLTAATFEVRIYP